MNIGYEDDELKPFGEPKKDMKDEKRIELMQQMGYSRNAIMSSLEQGTFDVIHALYILLGEQKHEVCFKLCYLFFKIFLFFYYSHKFFI